LLYPFDFMVNRGLEWDDIHDGFTVVITK
jgi:hypothetical protein